MEVAIGKSTVKELEMQRAEDGGAQYRPRMVEAPSRIEMLKKIQDEEVTKLGSGLTDDGTQRRSARMMGSMALNMGLDLEMKQ